MHLKLLQIIGGQLAVHMAPHVTTLTLLVILNITRCACTHAHRHALTGTHTQAHAHTHTHTHTSRWPELGSQAPWMLTFLTPSLIRDH